MDSVDIGVRTGLILLDSVDEFEGNRAVLTLLESVDVGNCTGLTLLDSVDVGTFTSLEDCVGDGVATVLVKSVAEEKSLLMLHGGQQTSEGSQLNPRLIIISSSACGIRNDWWSILQCQNGTQMHAPSHLLAGGNDEGVDGGVVDVGG